MTIWAFREQLTRKALYDRLFADLGKFLLEYGLIMNHGVIIDGSFVEMPRQRNTCEENRAKEENRVIKSSVRWEKFSKKQETVNRKNSETRVRMERGLQRVPILADCGIWDESVCITH